MIKARHHKLYQWFFDRWTFWLMRRHFHARRIHHQWEDQGGPLVLIGNHFSWWDGFIASYVNQQVFHRRIYVMMLEQELEKRKFLSRIGAFSIRKNSRYATESLKYAASVLQDPGHILLLYPQGTFQSLHLFPLRFEKGWFRILRQAPENTQLVFMASLTDYFSRKKPTLSIYLEACKQPLASAAEVEKAYNDFLKNAINQQSES